MAPQLAEDLARSKKSGAPQVDKANNKEPKEEEQNKEEQNEEQNNAITINGSPLIDIFIRLEAVKRATGLGRSTIYDLMSTGSFPKPVKIGNGKAVAWSTREVASWQRDKLAARVMPPDPA